MQNGTLTLEIQHQTNPSAIKESYFSVTSYLDLVKNPATFSATFRPTSTRWINTNYYRENKLLPYQILILRTDILHSNLFNFVGTEGQTRTDTGLPLPVFEFYSFRSPSAFM